MSTTATTGEDLLALLAAASAADAKPASIGGLPLPDRHELYQKAVQDPDTDVGFIEEAFGYLTRGELASFLREDFCGTGLLCGMWTRSSGGRFATGVDLSADTMQWGREHNLIHIGADARARVELLCGDVLEAPLRPFAASRGSGSGSDGDGGGFDVVCAFNFSYRILTDEQPLAAYFARVYRSLRHAVPRRPDGGAADGPTAARGVFLLDINGGRGERTVGFRPPRIVHRPGWGRERLRPAESFAAAWGNVGDDSDDDNNAGGEQDDDDDDDDDGDDDELPGVTVVPPDSPLYEFMSSGQRQRRQRPAKRRLLRDLWAAHETWGGRFTYVREIAAFDAATAIGEWHLHFALDAQRLMPRAFSYRFRLWTVSELSRLLLAAGFTRVVLFVSEPTGTTSNYECGTPECDERLLALEAGESWIGFLGAAC